MIKINNPCPMALARIKNKTNFYCKSCDKIIVDFRDKSVNEIVNYISKTSACGIFNGDQITKPKFSLKTNFLFKCLTFFAVLGFNVKPLSSQAKHELPKDTGNIHTQNIGQTKSQINFSDTTQVKKQPEKKKWWRKKKKHRVIIGLPY